MAFENQRRSAQGQWKEGFISKGGVLYMLEDTTLPKVKEVVYHPRGSKFKIPSLDFCPPRSTATSLYHSAIEI